VATAFVKKSSSKKKGISQEIAKRKLIRDEFGVLQARIQETRCVFLVKPKTIPTCHAKRLKQEDWPVSTDGINYR